MSKIFGLIFLLMFSVSLINPKPFSIILIPDTQYYTNSVDGADQVKFLAQTQWIVKNRDSLNIRFVLHEGDMTDRNDSFGWANAKAAMDILDGEVPYAMCTGNHDGASGSNPNTALFNQTFPLAKYDTLPNFGGAFEAGKMDNVYHFFNAGGINWLVMVLEFGPRDTVLFWASQIVNANPQRQVMVLTHSHVYYDESLHGSKSSHYWLPTASGRPNDGIHVWQKFVRKHKNISFVFNGHILGDGQGKVIGTGDFGNKVYQMLCNYQMVGNGFLRILNFDPAGDSFSAQSYSPYVNSFKTDIQNQFSHSELKIFINDSTAPLAAMMNPPVIKNQTVELNWDAAVEAESWIFNYEVYRDTADNPEKIIAILGDITTYSDSTQLEDAAFYYRIRAVNSYGLKGPYSNTVLAITAPDTVSPVVLGAKAISENQVFIVFSEKVDVVSAQDTMNYNLSAASVDSANLRSDGMTLDLFVSKLNIGADYELQISGVKDLAKLPNSMAIQNLSISYYFQWDYDFESPVATSFTVYDNASISGPSQWKIQGGVLNQFSNIHEYSSDFLGTLFIHNDTGFHNFDFNVDIKNGDDDGMGIVFGFEDSANYFRIRWDRQRNVFNLEQMVNHKMQILSNFSGKVGPFDQNVWYHLELSLVGQLLIIHELRRDSINLLTDSILLPSFKGNRVGFYSWGSDKVAFDNLHISRPQETVALDWGRNRSEAADQDFFISTIPNPFNPVTRLQFSKTVDRANIHIFNVQGKQVAQFIISGAERVSWDARGLSSGVYILNARVGNKFFRKSLLLYK